MRDERISWNSILKIAFGLCAFAVFSACGLFDIAAPVFAAAVTITGPSGDTYCFEGPDIPPCSGWALSSSTCVDGCLVAFQPKMNVVGAARANQYLNGVVFTGMGSSGNDGIVASTGGSSGFDLGLQPLSLNSTGAKVDLSATGMFNANPRTFLGHATLTNAGTNTIQVSADYSSIGSTSVLIQVFNSQTGLINSTIRPNGNVGTISTGGARLIYGGKIGGGSTSCIRADFDGIVTFASSPFSAGGDQIRLLAASPSQPIGNVQTFTLTAGNVGPSLTVTRAAITPAIPALNSFGGVALVFLILGLATLFILKRQRSMIR
jgi:hypothetical protein